MGEMADMSIQMCEQHEAEWDDYVTGGMSDHDAYELGIVDAQGFADLNQLDMVVQRNPIPTVESLDNELNLAYKDLVIADSIATYQGSVLNEEAMENLYKPKPTCNWCSEQMTERNGTYGKFYFCKCPEQGTVSDKYWQSIKR